MTGKGGCGKGGGVEQGKLGAKEICRKMKEREGRRGKEERKRGRE